MTRDSANGPTSADIPVFHAGGRLLLRPQRLAGAKRLGWAVVRTATDLALCALPDKASATDFARQVFARLPAGQWGAADAATLCAALAPHRAWAKAFHRRAWDRALPREVEWNRRRSR